MLRDHLGHDNVTNQLMMALLSYVKLKLGIGIQLLSLPYKGYICTLGPRCLRETAVTIP